MPSEAVRTEPVLREKLSCSFVVSLHLFQPSSLSVKEGLEINSVTSIGWVAVAELYLKFRMSVFKSSVALSSSSTVALSFL